jgi:hypothetical protein
MPKVGVGKAAKHFPYTREGQRKAKAFARKAGLKVDYGAKITPKVKPKPKMKITPKVKPKPKMKITPKVKPKKTMAQKYKKKMERRRARGKD